MRNIPCHMKEISCGQVCGKLLQCGEHTCRENCHPEPCPDWQPPKDALWYSEKRKKNKKKKSKAQKKKKNSEAVTTGNSASEGGSNEDGGAQPATARLSCGQVCGRVKKCGHLCKHMCHPGTACPEDPCMEMVQIHCGCGVRTTMAHCFCALDAAEKLECDDTCREVARRRMLADAFGIRPADGTVPAYSSFLIYYARAHRDYVAELEQTFAKFIAGPEAKLLPLDPRLDPIARKFALALAKYYGFSVFTDRDQTHSLTKLSIAGSPAVPLSVVAASEESSAIAAATNLKNTRRAADSSTCIDQEDHSFTLHITCNSSSSDSPDDHLDKKAIMDAVRPYNAVGCYFVSLGSREALVTARDENTLNAVRAKLAPLPITVT